ncbi:MAG: hypothetical protein PWQ96_1020 [Clostridia bacterium]|nr:hypothetical protein [Clostridiales bacterium]MDK2985378.1 hypothetical protein [Clostridia bacterium]
MWTVVYIAPTKKLAEKMERTLADEGVLVNLRPTNPDSERSSVEILVLESEAEEAHEIINQVLAT